MALATWRPDLWFGVNFASDPNDPFGIPRWSDVTNNVQAIAGYQRGRNYELDQAMAAEPAVTLRDVDEYFNPANPSSPYYGLIHPYREICGLATWPNVANTGNLFNSAAWTPNDGTPLDGSFESFAAGYAPSFLAAGGGAGTATVTTTTPFQGTKCATWAVAAFAVQQGQRLTMPTIPGRLYTTSFYVRQSSANIQRARVSGVTIAYDAFGRTVASTWASADGPSGTGSPAPSWTSVGGAASEYFVSAGTGKQSHAAANARRTSIIGSLSCENPNIYGTFKAPAMALGGFYQGLLVANYADASNNWYGGAQFNTDGTITALIQKRVAGVASNVASVVIPGVTYTAGSRWRMRFYIQGSGLSLKIWEVTADPATPEPNADTLVAGDTAVYALAGQVGTTTLTSASNTNTFPLAFEWDDFHAVSQLVGTATGVTGAYVRLSVTYLASQPFHYVTCATSGLTSLAGTVLLDAIQHEQAGAASAYTTAGSCIYPLARLLVERWPRTWKSAGFEGYAVAPCVDALAALNTISIPSEYEQLVMVFAPDYFWRLDDGADTLSFADTSGNHQAPLGLLSHKDGAGPLPQPNTAIEIAGDPGGTGVFIDAATPAAGGTTIATRTGGVTIPAVGGQPWAVTLTCWVKLTTGSPLQGIFDIGRLFNPSGPDMWRIYLETASSPLTYIQLMNRAGNIVNATVATDLRDNVVHHVAATVVQDATNTTLALYIDGQQVAANTVTTASIGGIIGSCNRVEIGGAISWGTASIRQMDGVIAQAAIWNRDLGAGAISMLYDAGVTAATGEVSGDRTLRHLQYGGYVPASNTPLGLLTNANAGVRIADGSTTMQPPTWQGFKDLLTDSQETTVAELGTVWVGPDGAVTIEGRQQRWLRLTPAFVLGENTAGGEYAYLGDVLMDWDPTFVFPDVRISRNNGSTVQGGSASDIQAASRRYYPRNLTGSSDFQTDQQAQDQADWIFNSHKAPLLRVESVTLNPASQPALWPIVLRAEVGQRITLKRRAKAANGGAGITMSADYFIENVAHEIDLEACTWVTRLRLSPIGVAPGITLQPWILEDPTLSVLGSTTVLGW